jgi:hypothetical protein
MRRFADACGSMREKVVESLLPAERHIFNVLTSEHQREGFLSVCAFAKAVEYKGDSHFLIARFSLADRLSITPPGAADVIQKLRGLEVISPTQPAVRHKSAARFSWFLHN